MSRKNFKLSNHEGLKAELADEAPIKASLALTDFWKYNINNCSWIITDTQVKNYHNLWFWDAQSIIDGNHSWLSTD